MASESNEDGGDVAAPEDVFSLVASDTRVEILQTLWEADDPLSFSELHDRTDVRDSGQFNYHLQKLVGQFVEKEPAQEPADVDHQYDLRYPGRMIVGGVYSGTYTRSKTVDHVDVDGRCLDCGGDLAAGYTDERAEVDCTECEVTVMSFEIPPVIVEEREPSELPQTFNDWAQVQMEFVTRGFCPLCNGATEPVVDETPLEDAAVDELASVVFECDRCGQVVQSFVGTTLLFAPSVVAFHHDHGIDLSSTPMWELEWLFKPHTTLLEDGYEVRIQLDEEVLVVVTDESLSVRDSHRRPR